MHLVSNVIAVVIGDTSLYVHNTVKVDENLGDKQNVGEEIVFVVLEQFVSIMASDTYDMTKTGNVHVVVPTSVNEVGSWCSCFALCACWHFKEFVVI